LGLQNSVRDVQSKRDYRVTFGKACSVAFSNYVDSSLTIETESA